MTRGRKAQQDLVRDIEAIRARIRKLKDERATLLDAPVPDTEALQRLDDWIAAQRAQYQSGASAAFVEREQGQVPPFIRGTVTGGGTVQFSTVEAALIWIAPDLVRAALAEEIAQYYRDRGAGVADDDREQRLEQLDDQLLELETEEERLIMRAEQAGITMLRRGDVDPRALVAAC